MDVPTNLKVTRCASGTVELARIQSLSREDAKRLIDSAWWHELKDLLCEPDDEPDRHWNWRQIVSLYQNKPYFRAVCVKTADGAVQAAMLFRVDALSAIEPGQRAVFVDRLATAPLNRDRLTLKPRFRGGGTGLLSYAVATSYSLGFSGRVNLIPVAGVDFYRKFGFVETSTVVQGERLFELPTGEALRLLQSRGLL